MEETIGKQISQHRKRLKLTQDQLAEQLGVTAQAVSKWENDQSCPDIATLPKLASILGISTDALLGAQASETVHIGEVLDPDDTSADAQENANGFHFEYNSGKRGAMALALFVLGVGVQMLICALLHVDISFWSVLWPTALLCFGIHGLFKKFSFLHIGCVLFGIYFLLDNWNLLPFQLGGEIVFPVVIVLLGLGLLADAFKKPKKSSVHVGINGESNKTKTEYSAKNGRLDYSASFGDDTRRVSLPIMHSGKIHTSFGDYTIDLSGVESLGSNCVLEAHASFGELTIQVPRHYAVQMDSSTAFADTSVSGHPDNEVRGTIHLEAHASFAEINVEYI